MLPSYTVVKKTAKTALKRKWTGTIIASSAFVFAILVQTLSSELIFDISTIYISGFFSTMFLLFLTFPLFIGLTGYFYCLAFDKKQSPVYVFRPFSSVKEYSRVFMLSLHLLLRAFGALIVFCLPSILASLLSYSGFYTFFGTSMPVWAPGLSILSVLLRIVGLGLTIAFMLKYYMAPFLFVANENISAAEAINQSKIITRGRISEFCWLGLSMILWILLSLLVMPLVFTLPYFFTSYIVHCRFCVADHNRYAGQADGSAPFFSPTMLLNDNERSS